MIVVNILVLFLFVALGIGFAKGKGVDLIAGYNTMSAAEKAKFDEKALCACMARMMFCLAGAWCVLSIGIQADLAWLTGLGFALFFGVIVFFLIYMNTGDRLNTKNKR